MALLDQAEAIVGAGTEWDLAKYAIVSWIDEMLVETPWDGRDWWSNNVLEVELFNTRLCNEQFYVRAQEASTLARRDALEVFYVCVVLGFRGLYRDPNLSMMFSAAHGLPPDLDTWARQASLAIRLGQGRPALVSAAARYCRGAAAADEAAGGVVVAGGGAAGGGRRGVLRYVFGRLRIAGGEGRLLKRGTGSERQIGLTRPRCVDRSVPVPFFNFSNRTLDWRLGSFGKKGVGPHESRHRTRCSAAGRAPPAPRAKPPGKIKSFFLWIGRIPGRLMRWSVPTKAAWLRRLRW